MGDGEGSFVLPSHGVSHIRLQMRENGEKDILIGSSYFFIYMLDDK